MGYALFTARKMNLTTKKNAYNMQLQRINRQQEELTKEAARFSKQQAAKDHKQNVESNAIEAQNKMLGLAGDAAKTFGGGTGMVIGLGIDAFTQGVTQMNDFKNNVIDTKQEIETTAFEEELSYKQTQLDIEKTKIETLLQAADAELQAIDKQQEQAIKNSTPKYTA